jgi:hypothetical protein
MTGLIASSITVRKCIKTVSFERVSTQTLFDHLDASASARPPKLIELKSDP